MWAQKALNTEEEKMQIINSCKYDSINIHQIRNEHERCRDKQRPVAAAVFLDAWRVMWMLTSVPGSTDTATGVFLLMSAHVRGINAMHASCAAVVTGRVYKITLQSTTVTVADQNVLLADRNVPATGCKLHALKTSTPHIKQKHHISDTTH